MKIYRVYCETAFDHQRSFGSLAFSIIENGAVLERSSCSEAIATANLTEMLSLTSALEELISIGATKEDKVYVYTVFKPICDAFDKGWTTKWEGNGWVNSEKRPVKHQKQWQAIKHLVDQLQVEFMHEDRESISMLKKLKKDARKALRII